MFYFMFEDHDRKVFRIPDRTAPGPKNLKISDQTFRRSLGAGVRRTLLHTTNYSSKISLHVSYYFEQAWNAIVCSLFRSLTGYAGLVIRYCCYFNLMSCESQIQWQYSLSSKIDAPKIDAFSQNSRNFQNSKFFWWALSKSPIFGQNHFRSNSDTLLIPHSPDFDQK